MSLKKEHNKKVKPASEKKEQFSLNDDRRVKVLSPGMLVAKRFFRNRLAVTGLAILIFMFVFSFVGGLISPYEENQFFYRDDVLNREFGSVTENSDFRYKAKDAALFTSPVQAQVVRAVQDGTPGFVYNGVRYQLTQEGEDFYSVYTGGQLIGIAYKDILSSSVAESEPDFDFTYAALKAYTAKDAGFTVSGRDYTLDSAGCIFLDGEEVAFISRFVVAAIMPDIFLSRDFKEKIVETILNGGTEFIYTDESLIIHDEVENPEDTEEGGLVIQDDAPPVDESEAELNATAKYTIERSQNHANWTIRQAQTSRQYDSYSRPSGQHLLGTDRYGMDMMTRLMYGGRVSLMIGFIVVFIETGLGIIFGGISGYFGGWVDNLIMRLVDIFYCIPSTPILIIIGAAMDAQRLDPTLRMIYLMLILGVLGWAGIARLVRGQILSLREQEFMTATEACGISVSHRIFKHLIPNVIPQLIVQCTMSLGGVIIMEATLSFLGLGVKFPFASWGNIITDVNNTFVLRNYWFIWIPAGVLLLLTVLAFNLVGDGLRDAFDPKMKR